MERYPIGNAGKGKVYLKLDHLLRNPFGEVFNFVVVISKIRLRLSALQISFCSLKT